MEFILEALFEIKMMVTVIFYFIPHNVFKSLIPPNAKNMWEIWKKFTYWLQLTFT